MSKVPPSSPPHAIFGLCLCLAVVVALGGCSTSSRLSMNDRPVPQPRPAVRPAPQPAPAPAPALKSGLGRPAETPTQVYTWNGSPERISEGAVPQHAAPRPTTPPQPQAYPGQAQAHSQAAAQPAATQLHAATPYQPQATAPPSAPVHLPRGSILVQPGDTLYGLSRRHGVSISALMDLNKLKSLSLVSGQVLKLPASARARG